MKNKLLQIIAILTVFTIVTYALMAHSCRYDDCTMKGQVTFSSDSEEGTDAYYIDLTHFNHPDFTDEQIETAVFGTIASK